MAQTEIVLHIFEIFPLFTVADARITGLVPLSYRAMTEALYFLYDLKSFMLNNKANVLQFA